MEAAGRAENNEAETGKLERQGARHVNIVPPPSQAAEQSGDRPARLSVDARNVNSQEVDTHLGEATDEQYSDTFK